MAGAGFKDFAVGEVLTASDVDTYLMQQSVMRFADSAARGSALGTATGTAVPLAEGMVSYLDDANYVQVFDGTNWRDPSIGIGANLAQTVKTDTFSASLGDGAGTAITGLTVNFTPTSSTSKVLVIAYVTAAGSANSAARGIGLILKRDGTPIGVGDAASNRTRGITGMFQAGELSQSNGAFAFLDSPATTSQVTYSVDIQNGDSGTQTLYVNRTVTDNDNARFIRSTSSLTAIEVAA